MPSDNRYTLRFWRSLFYAPIYASLAGGFLEREGLNVEFSTCPTQFAHPLTALNRDAGDIAQSGIMRSIIASDMGAETVPVHFAKINSRDGFFLLSSTHQEQFHWDSLRGAKVVPAGFSPTPWASLQSALRKHGVDPARLELLTGLSLSEAVAAFKEGQDEFVHVAEPTGEGLLAQGVGHMGVALGPENGHIPLPPRTGIWRRILKLFFGSPQDLPVPCGSCRRAPRKRLAGRSRNSSPRQPLH